MTEIIRKDEGPLNDNEIIGTVENFFAKQKRVDNLLRQFNEQEKLAVSNGGETVEVFHRVYIVGEVTPLNEDEPRVWWRIFPVDPISLKDGNLPQVLTKLRDFGVDYIQVADRLTLMHLNHIIPEPGDIIHIRRERDMNGSIINPVDVIKDIPKNV